MAVYVTGDIHGDPTRLSKNSFYEQKDFFNNKDENVVIILGDFGLVWNRDKESKQEKYWLDWLNKKPFTTVFVDGNHENHKRLSTYPIKEWHGGKVHEIRTHVLHLIRGEVFTIDETKFFALVGQAAMIFKMAFLITMILIGRKKQRNLINKVNICIVLRIYLGGKRNCQLMRKCSMESMY